MSNNKRRRFSIEVPARSTWAKSCSSPPPPSPAAAKKSSSARPPVSILSTPPQTTTTQSTKSRSFLRSRASIIYAFESSKSESSEEEEREETLILKRKNDDWEDPRKVTAATKGKRRERKQDHVQDENEDVLVLPSKPFVTTPVDHRRNEAMVRLGITTSRPAPREGDAPFAHYLVRCSPQLIIALEIFDCTALSLVPFSIYHMNFLVSQTPVPASMSVRREPKLPEFQLLFESDAKGFPMRDLLDRKRRDPPSSLVKVLLHIREFIIRFSKLMPAFECASTTTSESSNGKGSAAKLAKTRRIQEFWNSMNYLEKFWSGEEELNQRILLGALVDLISRPDNATSSRLNGKLYAKDYIVLLERAQQELKVIGVGTTYAVEAMNKPWKTLSSFLSQNDRSWDSEEVDEWTSSVFAMERVAEEGIGTRASRHSVSIVDRIVVVLGLIECAYDSNDVRKDMGTSVNTADRNRIDLTNQYEASRKIVEQQMHETQIAYASVKRIGGISDADEVRILDNRTGELAVKRRQLSLDFRSKSYLNRCSSALRFQSVGTDSTGHEYFIPSATPLATLPPSIITDDIKGLAPLGHSLLICGDLTFRRHRNQLDFLENDWLQITDAHEIKVSLEHAKRKQFHHQWCFSVLRDTYTDTEVLREKEREAFAKAGKDLKERVELFISHLKWLMRLELGEVAPKISGDDYKVIGAQ